VADHQMMAKVTGKPEAKILRTELKVDVNELFSQGESIDILKIDNFNKSNK
jgi:hypothetical protein